MNKQLKKIMTDLAAGHISKREADILRKVKKVHPRPPIKEIKHTRKRKQVFKKERGVKII